MSRVNCYPKLCLKDEAVGRSGSHRVGFATKATLLLLLGLLGLADSNSGRVSAATLPAGFSEPIINGPAAANWNEYFAATIGRITRYTARTSDGFKSVDYTSRLVLLGETKNTGFPILYQSHGVGSLVFGTDGTLLASCGEGASYSSDDIGNAPETYYAQALSDGILKPKENVGAYRA